MLPMTTIKHVECQTTNSHLIIKIYGKLLQTSCCTVSVLCFLLQYLALGQFFVCSLLFLLSVFMLYFASSWRLLLIQNDTHLGEKENHSNENYKVFLFDVSPNLPLLIIGKNSQITETESFPSKYYQVFTADIRHSISMQTTQMHLVDKPKQ